MEVPGTEPIEIENLWFQFAPEVKEHRLLLGTHFDTRPWPDREEDESLHRVRGVIGACDGGSGAAILLELATVLSEKHPNIPLDIVLFDAEEPLPKEFIPQGYFLGSRKFVLDRVEEGALSQYGSVLVIDVVGGKDAKVGLDQSSVARTPRWAGRVQGAIDQLNLPSFRPPANYSIWDDHTAFQNAGVPAALLIDYDYPYLDTLKDTLDKCSEQSLRDVGQAVLQVVISHSKNPMKDH
jgi:Zn-dependent M28 family amino/carboxypeptidase